MNAWRNSLLAAATMVIFSMFFTALMALVFAITSSLVAKNEENAKLALLEQVLAPGSYDNDLLHSTMTLHAAQSRQLGNTGQSQIYLAQKKGLTESIIVEATAADGYSGNIKLLISINRQGIVQAVRVLSHKETPGLGDYIEQMKSAWILQFCNKSLQQPEAQGWQVKKDGGIFDYMSGATISPRAIIKTVHHTLAFVMENQVYFFGKG